MTTRASVPVLTIDGPSGSGKGTIARAVAERLGWHLLDSGAIYRAVGYADYAAGIRTHIIRAAVGAAAAAGAQSKGEGDEQDRSMFHEKPPR